MLGTENFMAQIYSAERTRDILCWKKEGKNEMYLLCLIYFFFICIQSQNVL